MKSYWRHIIAAACAVPVIGYAVFGITMARHHVQEPTCQRLAIQITDLEQRRYMDENELVSLLKKNNQYPVGAYMARVPAQRIEETLKHHPMVRTCECYKTSDGVVHVNLTQRVPLVRIVTAGESYFIDTDRKRMPIRATVTTPVLPITGDVSPRRAAGELSDFAEWLQKQPYWSGRIARLHVSNPKMIHLIQSDSLATIVMGEMNDYTAKLGKLQHWYEAGKTLDLNQYTSLDVRYKGQVIGIK